MNKCRVIQNSYKKDNIHFKCFPSILLAIMYADPKLPNFCLYSHFYNKFSPYFTWSVIFKKTGMLKCFYFWRVKTYATVTYINFLGNEKGF